MGMLDIDEAARRAYDFWLYFAWANRKQDPPRPKWAHKGTKNPDIM